jgi:hypothetical protein
MESLSWKLLKDSNSRGGEMKNNETIGLTFKGKKVSCGFFPGRKYILPYRISHKYIFINNIPYTLIGFLNNWKYDD